jgi:alpha-L-fucosidase
MGTIEVSQQVIGEPSTKVILQATAIEGDTLPESASITLVPIQE